jgi:hypothetical protein
VRGRTLTVRAIALFGAASAAIHQLRYAIGYGDGAPHALASHHHGYLDAALPGIATAAVIALAAVLIRVARGESAGRGSTSVRRSAALPSLWLGCTLALAAIFGVQETLEGAGAFAGGGWIGLALAVPAGLLVALALRGADAAQLRMRGATLRIRFISFAQVGVGPASGPARLLDLRFGARAPPHPCVG